MRISSTSAYPEFVTALRVAAVIVLLVAFATTPALAKVNSIHASASPLRLELGDSFIYQVTVEGSGSLPTPNNNIPSAFQIISGPNSNISMEFINGKMSSTRTLTYTLRALRRGEFTIPAPVVTEGGQQKMANPVTIVVEAPGDVASQPAPNDMVPQQNNVRQRQLDPIFLQADIEPTSVYLQEALVLTFTLFFQPSVRTYDVQRLPSTEGFWSEEWAVPNPPGIVERNINGHLYNAAVIHRIILFPTRTGELTIGPMDLVVHYVGGRSRSRSFFDSIFDSYVDQMNVSSNPITVNVKSLPEQGQPDGFQNVVGNWSLDARLDSDAVQTNESVMLTVTISGEGNVGFLPAPEVRVPPDIELYEPEVDLSKRPSNGTITGRKTFSYLLIPRRPGTQMIPAVELSFFDPGRKQYRTLRAEPGALNVTAASGWAASDVDGSGVPARVETVGQDIRWIMDSSSGLKSKTDPLHQRGSYWAGYLLPMLIALAGFGIRKRRDTLAGQQSLLRSRKAAKHALNALKEARELHGQGQIGDGYNALARGIISYLSERLNVPNASLDDRGRRELLGANDVSTSSQQELRDILNICDTARFGPHGSDAGTLANVIERSKNWITTVDRQLKPVKV